MRPTKSPITSLLNQDSNFGFSNDSERSMVTTPSGTPSGTGPGRHWAGSNMSSSNAPPQNTRLMAKLNTRKIQAINRQAKDLMSGW
jgi:hypothetical protein